MATGIITHVPLLRRLTAGPPFDPVQPHLAGDSGAGEALAHTPAHKWLFTRIGVLYAGTVDCW